MNVVDSSAWLEYFADGPNAQYFAPAIVDAGRLIVPSVCLYEVFKRVTQQRGHGPALQAVAVMQQGTVVDLNVALALFAADLSLQHRLPLADSIVLAAARTHDAVLWTQDADFENLEGVRYCKKAAR
jgi:toxin FitB